jgi:DNA-binding MarR family transcriptional regulator
MNNSQPPSVAQPRPPMDILTAQLSFTVYAAARAMAACYRPLLAPLGLTHTQYLVMLVLWERQLVTVGDLGERLHLDSGTISPLLTRLERAKLIHRHRSPDDERVVEVSASALGRALRARAAAVPVEMARATGMTRAEIISLRDTLQVLIMRLRAAEPRLPPVA